MYADWGAAGSLCDALFDATGAAGDTAIAASFDCNGSTFTCNVFPNFPAIGGGATDVLTTTVEFVVEDGSVSRA
jgi:hypothetical protein